MSLESISSHADMNLDGFDQTSLEEISVILTVLSRIEKVKAASKDRAQL